MSERKLLRRLEAVLSIVRASGKCPQFEGAVDVAKSQIAKIIEVGDTDLLDGVEQGIELGIMLRNLEMAVGLDDLEGRIRDYLEDGGHG